MSSTATLFLYHRPNDDGLHPVKLYVRVGGRPVRISTGISIPATAWDAGLKKIKGQDNLTHKRNLILKKQVAEADNILADYELMRVPLSPERFRIEFRSPNTRLSFLEYYRENMQNNYERRLIGKAKYEAELRTLSKLSKFRPGGVLFSDISRRLIEDFDAYHASLLAAKGADGAQERIKALKHINKYLRAAKEDQSGLYRFTWPFHGFTWPKHQTAPVFLTEKEVRGLLSLYERPETILQRMRDRAAAANMADWNTDQYATRAGVERVQRIMQRFLFQCFSGLRCSDVERIEWGACQGEHLVFTPHKTRRSSGAEVRMLLAPMLRRFMPARAPKRKTIFPTLSNQKYNEYLKEVAELARIDKHLTSHVGRHTFATMSLMRGVKMSVLQRLLGVTNVKTLMIYVHITESHQDEAMQAAYSNFL